MPHRRSCAAGAAVQRRPQLRVVAVTPGARDVFRFGHELLRVFDAARLLQRRLHGRVLIALADAEQYEHAQCGDGVHIARCGLFAHQCHSAVHVFA